MARKKKRARSFNATPLVLVALLLAAAVVWAILPRPHKTVHRVTRDVSSVARPSPSAAADVETPLPSPSAQGTAEAVPSLSPSAAPSQNPGGPQVAIIIDDCGQWISTERGILALPIPLTLSVLPHVPYTAQIAQEAANAGKGIMMHLPMEPLSHANPGPGEIKTAMSDDAIAKQTEDDLAQVPLAKGVNNHEGSAASADDRVMKDVITVVKEHNLFFIDSRTNAKSVAASQAQDAGVPNASRDVFLDNQADVAYTESMLERTVAIAKQNGSAVAIGHPKPTTLEALRLMYPKMQSEGVRFVLASDLVR